jgi:hypothetical protein
VCVCVERGHILCVCVCVWRSVCACMCWGRTMLLSTDRLNSKEVLPWAAGLSMDVGFGSAGM